MGRIWSIILIYGCMVLAACTSARKISRVERVEPGSPAAAPSVEQPPSRLRQSASKMQHGNACESQMVRRIRALALKRWPKAGCPSEFAQQVQKVTDSGGLSGSDQTLLDALKRIDCRGQGLLANNDGSDSLAESVKTMLGKTQVTAEPVRDVASQSQIRALQESLQKILNLNVPLEQKISSSGDYLLSEDNLDFMVTLVNNNCRLRTVQQHFNRDNSMLLAMEANEALIVDPALKREYSELRKGMLKIFNQSIKSFF